MKTIIISAILVLAVSLHAHFLIHECTKPVSTTSFQRQIKECPSCNMEIGSQDHKCSDETWCNTCKKEHRLSDKCE
jgi:hypothetical protein